MYDATAYCETNGRCARIPLRIRVSTRGGEARGKEVRRRGRGSRREWRYWTNGDQGKGIGPKATFSFDVLDIGEVFVNSLHKYEVTIQNDGNILKLSSLQLSPFLSLSLTYV